MRYLALALALALLLFISTESFAKAKWKLTNFEIGGVRFRSVDSNWETNAFVDFAWTPMWDNGTTALHANFEITSSKDRGGERFLVTGYQGFALLHIYTVIALEAGAGFQTWHTSLEGGTFPIISGNLLLRVGEDLFDRVYLGYGYVSNGRASSNVFRAGTSFNF